MRRRPAARSVAQQGFVLRGRYPDATLDLRAGRLVWTGRLAPTPLSRGYTVQVIYRAGGVPQVRVLDPPLDGRLGESLPHVYREGTLCLYRAGEWNDAMLIAGSIIPWAAEWLFFYEIWKATGDWHGGGEPPPLESSDSLALAVAAPPAVAADAR